MVRLEIITRDRLGITVAILEKIYNRKINLISMEVFFQRVCVKIDEIEKDLKELIINELLNIEDVLTVKEIELLYYEENERKIHAVIDSVGEGIISIDKNFKINIFNNYCEELFNSKKDDVTGTDIRELIDESSPFINLITNSIEYNNVEFNSKIGQKKINYISTGKVIKSDNGETVGGVATIKDINEARKLASVISNIEDDPFKEIIGRSKSIIKVKNMTSTIAKSESTVLLRGESGTGKELFARAIYNMSGRKNEKFITINCAALPENLLESELFGYEKGSFTGAMKDGKNGLFKEAHGGTLFLDEIGEMSVFLQAKLLRVLQEGKIRKIGSNHEEKVDVRIIAATNRNLEQMIKENLFREDLYYRLNVIPLYIPRLKDRKEDIPDLIQYFIQKLNYKMKKNIIGAEIEFISALMNYEWPGNIRELQNVVERAMNLCKGDMLTKEELIIDITEVSEHLNNELSERINEEATLKDIVDKCEKEAIEKTIREHKSYRKAAKVLGVSHTTIMNKINKYNIIV